MADVVIGIAALHAPNLANPSLVTGVKEVQYAAVKAGFAEARALLEQARPDAIVIFSTDHFDRCFFMTTYKGNEVITKYARAPELEQVAGNGEQEVRDWRAVAGAMQAHLKRRVLSEEPLPGYGVGVMAWAAD